MTEFIIVITATPSQEEAQAIAEAAIEQRLAAAVQLIGPIRSTFRWNEKIQRSEECLGVSLPDCYATYMSERRLQLWRLGMLRFRERMLEEGMRVYVLGTATPRAQSHVVSLDGELAATGSDTWSDRVHREQQQHIAGVIRRGDHERTFLISQDSERMLHLTLGIERPRLLADSGASLQQEAVGVRQLMMIDDLFARLALLEFLHPGGEMDLGPRGTLEPLFGRQRRQAQIERKLLSKLRLGRLLEGLESGRRPSGGGADRVQGEGIHEGES